MAKAPALIELPLEDMTGSTYIMTTTRLGGLPMALRIYWISRVGKMFLRVETEAANLFSGWLNADDPVFIEGAFNDRDNPDFAIALTSNEDGAILTPATLKSDFFLLLGQGIFRDG